MKKFEFEKFFEGVEDRVRQGTSTPEDTRALVIALRAGIDKFYVTATESESWDRAAGAADVFSAMSLVHQSRVRRAIKEARA